MEQSLQGSVRCSPTIMPFLALGHVVPALGAIRTATGEYRFPIPVLGMLVLTIGIVDALDSSRDISPSQRPTKWIWRLWMYFLTTGLLVCIFLSGLQTAIQAQRFLLIGLCWQMPCIPLFKNGFQLFKPKAILREAKSLFVATCLGYFTAEASMFHYCHGHDNMSCSPHPLRTRSLCLAILYHFLRETANDTRDVDEDTRNGVRTLPVLLGKNKMLLVMAGLGFIMDSLLTANWNMSVGSGAHAIALLCSFSRVASTILAYTIVLRYPRNNLLAWGSMALFGLTPVLWAQGAISHA